MAFLFKSSKKSHSKKNGYDGNSGVGIVFKSGPDEALFVKSITEGGPASLSDPPIRVNDCLLKVDGEDVYRMPINKVVDYILGEENSSIDMTFQRFAGNKLESFTVSLRRGRAATIRADIDTRALEAREPQSIESPQLNASSQDQQGQNQMRGQLSHKEKQADTQAKVGERLEKMREMKDFTALSFTGRGSKEDPTGTYEGDLNQVGWQVYYRLDFDNNPFAQNGKRHGKGIMKYRTGDLYEGEWLDDCMHGQGIMVYTNGEKYRGEWNENKRHGIGVHQFLETSRYEGEFANDHMDGTGTFYYRNGSIYKVELSSAPL